MKYHEVKEKKTEYNDLIVKFVNGVAEFGISVDDYTVRYKIFITDSPMSGASWSYFIWAEGDGRSHDRSIPNHVTSTKMGCIHTVHRDKVIGNVSFAIDREFNEVRVRVIE